MYAIKITNLVTNYEFPIEDSVMDFGTIKEWMANACSNIGAKIVEWDTDRKGGMYMIAKSDDDVLQYKIEIILK